MARVCEICGKGVRTGNSIVRHGLAKKKGGIGLHTTGVNRRLFYPNLQRIRVVESGGVVRRNVCTACIKAGKVAKA
jgi:large subunit ribosomal protein L28